MVRCEHLRSIGRQAGQVFAYGGMKHPGPGGEGGGGGGGGVPRSFVGPWNRSE